MTETLDRIMEQYGQRVRLGETEVRAFFQPVTDKSAAAPFTVTSLGMVDGRKWIYLGRTAVQAGDAVVFQGEAYTVDNCRELWLGDEPAYCWAALTKERETAE